MKKVKLFGFLGAFIAPEIKLDLPDKINKNIILSVLKEQYPMHQTEFLQCNVAVNQVYIFDEEVDSRNIEEIAIIPPVSGG